MTIIVLKYKNCIKVIQKNINYSWKTITINQHAKQIITILKNKPKIKYKTKIKLRNI